MPKQVFFHYTVKKFYIEENKFLIDTQENKNMIKYPFSWGLG